MDDTKKLIEKYKRELMELGRNASVIGYIDDKPGGAVFGKGGNVGKAQSERNDGRRTATTASVPQQPITQQREAQPSNTQHQKAQQSTTQYRETQQREVQQPNTQRREVQQPTVQQQEAQQSTAQQREAQQPNTQQQEVQQPTVQQQEAQQSTAQQREAQHPNTQQREAQQPNTQQREAQQPNTQQQEAQQSTIQQREVQQPEMIQTEPPILQIPHVGAGGITQPLTPDEMTARENPDEFGCGQKLEDKKPDSPNVVTTAPKAPPCNPPSLRQDSAARVSGHDKSFHNDPEKCFRCGSVKNAAANGATISARSVRPTPPRANRTGASGTGATPSINGSVGNAPNLKMTPPEVRVNPEPAPRQVGAALNAETPQNTAKETQTINESEQGNGEIIYNIAPRQFSSWEEFSEMNSGSGTLRFRVYTAREALPLEGALCVVSMDLNGGTRRLSEQVTNSSGQTEPVSLPTPPKSYSQDVNNSIQPFALYNAAITKDGYIDVVIKDIPVFDGVLSVQRVAMVPSEEGESNAE